LVGGTPGLRALPGNAEATDEPGSATTGYSRHELRGIKPKGNKATVPFDSLNPPRPTSHDLLKHLNK